MSAGGGTGLRRVVVVGTPGAGKTTVGRQLAARLGVPSVELDGLFHLPGWGKPDPDEFRAKVGAALDAAPDGWVTDGNYASAVTEVWQRADTVVWLDLGRPLVMARLLRRTAGRVARGTELWAGNRERLRDVLAWDPERSILRWGWTRFPVYRRRYGEAMADPAWRHLHFVRLRTPAEVSAFLAAQGEPPTFPERTWGSDRGPLAAAGRRFVGTAAGSAVVRALVPWDRRLLARSGGRFTVLGPFGVPLLLLTTTGSVSGRPRTTPLVYLREGPRLVVAASNFGGPRHPAWSTNLLARPEATVTVAGQSVPVVATLLEGEARRRVWPRFVALGPYGVYERRTSRTIRVFALTRVRGGDGG